MEKKPSQPIKLFICSAHEDESLCQLLQKHLSGLTQRSLTTIWHDRLVSAGAEREREVDKHLKSSDIVLFLISPDFMVSDHCRIEMEQAMERSQRGELRVVPVLLRPVDFADAPFSKLQFLPTDGKAITQWSNQDEACSLVVDGIKAAIKEIIAQQKTTAIARLSSSQTPLLFTDTLSVQMSNKPVIGTILLTYRYIGAIDWSPDEKYFASGSSKDDRQNVKIYIWDASTGKTLQKLQTAEERKDRMIAIAWSPNGNLLAAVFMGWTLRLHVWEITTGKEVLSTESSHHVMAWSPDGQSIALGGHDWGNTLKVWNITNGTFYKLGRKIPNSLSKLISHYSSYDSGVNTVAWSPDGQLLASGGYNYVVQVWEVATHREISRYENYTAVTLAWSPNGQLLASGSRDRTIRVWNVTSEQAPFTYHGHSAEVSFISWSSDGERIASAAQEKHEIQIWQAS